MMINSIAIHTCSGPQASPFSSNLVVRAIAHILMRMPCNLGLLLSWDYLDSIICFHFQVSLILKDFLGRADAWRFLFVCLFINGNDDGVGWLYPPPHALASHVTSWKHVQDVNLC